MLKTTKQIVPAALIMCVLAGFMLALGTRPAAPPPVSIAVVDLEKVFAGLDKRAKKEEELKASKAEAQAKLSAMEEKLKKLNNDITIIGNGPERKALVIERARLLVNARYEKEFSEQVLAIEEGEVLRELYNEIDAAAEQIAKQRGFNMVFSNDEKLAIPENVTREGIERVASLKKILYVDPSMDITADVITFMNNQYKANVPTAAAPGAKSAAPAPTPAAASGKK